MEAVESRGLGLTQCSCSVLGDLQMLQDSTSVWRHSNWRVHVTQ
jgi:hypothetical protein